MLDSLISQIARYVVGHADLLRLMAVALLTEGHILIQGPPGTGKTLAAKLFAQSIGGTFKRIQGVPDMLPSDITGTYYYNMARSPLGEGWTFREGPIFANVVLVDEINRLTPRTQAALLEAMQEGRVTVDGDTRPLPRPFLLIATQMTASEEGTYPLTPNLLDRFAYSYRTGYPDPQAEAKVLEKVDEIDEAARVGLKPAVQPPQVVQLQAAVRSVHVSDKVRTYIVDLLNHVRRDPDVQLGPTTRAAVWLLKGARALAYLEGLDYVAPDHVKQMAHHVLQHRIVLAPEAALRGVSPGDVVERALKEVEVPKL